MLLRVIAPHFVAAAVFQKVDGVWKVQRTAPILSWMHKQTLEEIHAGLTKAKTKGWSYEWIK